MNSNKRKARLIELIKRIDDGHDITTRDMKIILTEEEYSEFELMWNSEKDKRTAIKPKSVKDYEKLLNKWHIAEARSERYRKRKNINFGTKDRMNWEVDTMKEKIQEYLTENRDDIEFNLWLDRANIADTFDAKIDPENPSNTLDSPALVSTSRSIHNQSNGFMYQLSKRDIKKIVLDQALRNMEPASKEPEMDEILEHIKKNRGSFKKDKFKGWKI
jgi:hypothetical protein